MIRFQLALVVIAAMPGLAMAQDTLASRLKHLKHVGLSIDEKLGAYTVYVYTDNQYQENAASLAQNRVERKTLKSRFVSYNRDLRDAQERNAAKDEFNAINSKYDLSEMANSPFETRIKLHTVVAAGEDYFAMESLDDSTKLILLPYAKIGRVIFTKTDDPPSTTQPKRDEPYDATERRSRAN